jgi:hypothetical protein
MADCRPGAQMRLFSVILAEMYRGSRYWKFGEPLSSDFF